MKWHHILDKQPEDNEEIAQLDPMYEGKFERIGFRKYRFVMPFDEVLAEHEKMGWPTPDFWWISYKDFPFPVRENEDG